MRTVSHIALVGAEGLKLDELIDTIEREMILEALKQARGSKVRAAKLLGVDYRSFRYRCSKHGAKVPA